MGDADKNSPRVTVIGGGVAGLTVAHELAVRGFAVQVIESNRHPHRAGDCHVGGMARTQWSRYPSNMKADVAASAGLRRARKPLALECPFVKTQALRYCADAVDELPEIRFAQDCASLDERATSRLAAVAEHVHRYFNREIPWNEPGETISVAGFFSPGECPECAQKRANTVADALKQKISKGVNCKSSLRTVKIIHDRNVLNEMPPPGSLRIFAVGIKDRHLEVEKDYPKATCTGKKTDPRCAARLLVDEIRLPGEHGYRFFPAFYSHLFDTMRRTPLLIKKPVEGIRGDIRRANGAPRYRYEETGQTAFDNLVPVELHGFAPERRGEPKTLRRLRPRSFAELRRTFEAFQEKLGADSQDLSRMTLKFFQFMTSCDARRHQLSRLSWEEYLGLTDFSDSFRESMNDWPQALVGLRVEEADARTAGEITVQMLLDQIRPDGYRDGTLNGPTDVAWLEPWRLYLEQQGVKFKQGVMTGFKVDYGVVIPELPREVSLDRLVVLALPVEQLQKMLVKFKSHLVKNGEKKLLENFNDSQFADVLKFLGDFTLQDAQEKPSSNSPLRHYSGIQYYLEHDVPLIRGHLYIPNTGWGLSAISQTQFWKARPDFREDYRGIVSVDVGAWDESTPGSAKTLWDQDPDEIAEGVWKQITDRVQGVDDAPISQPIFYHIDDAIKFPKVCCQYIECEAWPERRSGVARNTTPFLLTIANEWSRRPGQNSDGAIEYKLSMEKLPRQDDKTEEDTLSPKKPPSGFLMAGVFMATHTRITSMEAANESARHAVNAILKEFRFRNKEAELRSADPCQIYPLMERELEDLEVLRRLDAALMKKGTPHMIEILLGMEETGGATTDRLTTAIERLAMANLSNIFTRYIRPLLGFKLEDVLRMLKG